jgi:hypothetical protein
LLYVLLCWWASKEQGNLVRQSDLEYPLELIENTGLRWLAHSFLFVGEVVMDSVVEIAKNHPQYFKPLPSAPVIAVITSDTSIPNNTRMLLKDLPIQ